MRPWASDRLASRRSYLLVSFEFFWFLKFLKNYFLFFFFNLERADFEEQGAKDFRRLTNSQAVGLKYGEIVVKVKKVHKNGDKVVKIDVEAQPAAEADKVDNC